MGGSRSFDGNDSISIGARIANNKTWTAFGWMWSDSVSVSGGQSLWAEGNSGTTVQIMGLQWNDTVAGDAEGFARDDASNLAQVLSGDIDTNNGAWHSFMLISNGASSLTLYVDGSSIGTSTVTRGTTTMNTGNIGALQRTTTINFAIGRIAHVCLWTGTALSSALIAFLSSGGHPRKSTTPATHYFPLLGLESSELDVIGGVSGTVNGATEHEDGPPLIFAMQTTALGCG